MNVDAYLARLGMAGPAEPSFTMLERLQRAHLTHVPFENLDVFHRRGVRTDPEWAASKIIDRGRGGWCYEVNGAFATLLDRLGFSVKWLGATVLPADSPGPDHLAIEVTLDRPYLVDVGFGDSFIRPLPLDTEGSHDGGTGAYRFDFDGDITTLVAVDPDRVEPQYRFGSGSFTAEDFEAPSRHLQTEPGLSWTERPFATRLLDGGPDRVTLLHDRIKFRRNGEWTEQPVAPGGEWALMLDAWFSMAP
jgi:N-hydroxyarylamine O-acetyltransferase